MNEFSRDGYTFNDEVLFSFSYDLATMDNVELGKVGEDTDLLAAEKLALKKKQDAESDDFRPLTREDLIRLDAQEPRWRRIRLALLVLSVIVWLGLLVAAILLLVFTPKCPPKPKQEFWQSKVGYWLNPFAFKDSDGDGVGDIKGMFCQNLYLFFRAFVKLKLHQGGHRCRIYHTRSNNSRAVHKQEKYTCNC